MRNIPEIFSSRPLYIQLLFTAFAFWLMVILSCIFTSRIVRTNLLRNADNILDYVESTINSDLLESSTILDSFSQSIQNLVRRGDGSEKLAAYNADISSYLRLKDNQSISSNGPYCYIEKSSEGPFFVNGIEWRQSDNWRPTERPWYKAAIAASNCNITQSEPYEDTVTGEMVFTYSRCIFDEDGNRLGVAAIDIRAGHIGERVANTALAKDGFGILISQDLTVIGHMNQDFIGLKMNDPVIPLSFLTDELVSTGKVTGAEWVNWRGETVVGFFKTLSNGWRLGLLAPQDIYYKPVYDMALSLSILGIALAAVLIIVLIRVDAAKNKSDSENRHKSAFLANMSHEIRTPMNAIIGMLTIGKSAADIERKNYCFTKIEDATNHLLGVLNDILDMTKIEANKLEISPAEFNLDEIIQRVVNVINFKLDEKHQNFVLHIDRSIPRALIGDDHRIMQVITNLLGNAVKFTPENGAISLAVHLAGEENNLCTLKVSVSDTGIGISEEQQKKLFRSFEQAESSTTRKYGGTGLGLAISKRIVEMMGGRIWVESAPGKGSAFIFTIPLARATEAANEPQPNPQESVEAEDAKSEETQISDLSGVFAGRHILLAEDVEINREIVQALLEPTQLDIDCAENGAEAVRKFTEAPLKYDMIIMDIQMPEMDGYEATRRIRAVEAELRSASTASSSTFGGTRANKGMGFPKGVPIVAMSANVFREDIERCLDAGMNSHIGKPVNFDEVIVKLRSYLAIPA